MEGVLSAISITLTCQFTVGGVGWGGVEWSGVLQLVHHLSKAGVTSNLPSLRQRFGRRGAEFFAEV